MFHCTLWRSRDNIVNSVLSSYFYLGSQRGTQVTQACLVSAFTHSAISPAPPGLCLKEHFFLRTAPVETMHTFNLSGNALTGLSFTVHASPLLSQACVFSRSRLYPIYFHPCSYEVLGQETLLQSCSLKPSSASTFLMKFPVTPGFIFL